MYFIRAAPAVAWNSLCSHVFYFRGISGWAGLLHAHSHARTWPCVDYVRGLALAAWICRQGVDRKLVCTRTCLWRTISRQLWGWHQRVEVRWRRGGWGPRQPLGWKLVLAVPPWDWRVSRGLFLWLLFASKLRAALMNVACVNLEALLGNHGKMENRILVCHPWNERLGQHPSSWSTPCLWGSSQQLGKRYLPVPAWHFYRVSCSAKS